MKSSPDPRQELSAAAVSQHMDTNWSVPFITPSTPNLNLEKAFNRGYIFVPYPFLNFCPLEFRVTGGRWATVILLLTALLLHFMPSLQLWGCFNSFDTAGMLAGHQPQCHQLSQRIREPQVFGEQGYGHVLVFSKKGLHTEELHRQDYKVIKGLCLVTGARERCSELMTYFRWEK